MTLSTGTRLSHYEITSQIGKGGMGEVYQATDTKLGRDVAIKVLPQEFTKDTERVARFQREAKLLASLNHPNIAAIYGLEEAEGTHFLVLELIEGNTLADRIKAGAIPVEEALKLALQISEALEAAHEKGVIHRDLKPANIKVTPDGKVKVLDFGLAKAYAGDTENMNLSNSPTLSDAATQQGVILGTAAYMSPEQARGTPVDKRADIWAFGVVLFEMLTGRQIFSENTVSDTLASVLKSEPEWESLPQNLHPRIRLLLERCMEKEAKNRYHDIADARVDIQKVLADPSGVFSQPSLLVKPRKQLQLSIPRITAIVILCLIIAGVAGWLLKPAPSPEPKSFVRFAYELPEDQQLSQFVGIIPLAVSPDGSQFVYSTTEGLYIRYMSELNARLIPGTDKDALFPVFSPDGKWIAYFTGSTNSAPQLKKIPIAGGIPTVLCEIDLPIGGANWDIDDMIVYCNGSPGRIMRVSASSGTPESLFESQELTVFPQMLPDGKTLLFTSGPNPFTESHIELLSLESGERKELFEKNFGAARYLPTGHIIYSAENNLYAAPFDLDTLEVTGAQVPMVEGIRGWGISDKGMLVYVPGRIRQLERAKTQPAPIVPRTLVWVDREGIEEPLAADPDNYLDIRISPDGTNVALVIGDQESSDIWILDLDRGNKTRLTFFEGNDIAPVWTPDSKQIIFSSDREKPGIYIKAANGIGEAELIFSSDRNLVPCSISSDGKTLLFFEADRQTGTPFSGIGRNFDIAMLSMEGEPERKVLLEGDYEEATTVISPDDKYMVYESNESGQYEIYIRPFPDVNKDRKLVSTNGGEFPRWSPDGRELYYLITPSNIAKVMAGSAPKAKADMIAKMTAARPELKIMAVTVETEPTLKLGNPEILFQGSYMQGRWDIHPIDKRFLMIKIPERTDDQFQVAESQAEESIVNESQAEEFRQQDPRKITIVLNWFEELKENVPVP
jgi:serine/threonine protein kinase